MCSSDSLTACSFHEISYDSPWSNVELASEDAYDIPKASILGGKKESSQFTVDNKENCMQPVLQITGGTNITINFGSIPKL